ncbi:MAG: phage portal protein [Nitrospirae bacterium]|nr:phage portal protein [Magnetococcales bacterium]
MLLRSYEGAKTGRRTDGWIATGLDANSEIGNQTIILRNRARDLVRNNPFAAKAVATYASSLVGTGITPRLAASSARSDDITSLWDEFSGNCDADGRSDFNGLQTLMATSMVESGECLLQMINMPSDSNMKVPLLLRVLEADHLDNSLEKSFDDGGYIQQGIEFDIFGNRVAYHLYPTHPGSSSLARRASFKSIRVPATDILHIYNRTRPGQHRGVTWFAPALLRMQDLDDYDDAELLRKKMESCFVAFVVNASPTDALGIKKGDPSGPMREQFEPGMIEYLPPGKDIRFGSPAQTSGYVEYMRWHYHAVSAALGLTYELLTGDLSQVNYSSLRAGLIEFRRRIEATQHQLLIPQLCNPIGRRFFNVVQAKGLLKTGNYSFQWTPPRFEAVDPQRDTMGEILLVRAGLMTLSEAIARQGYDPETVLAEIARTNQQLDNLNLKLTTDPRYTVSGR